MMYIFDLVFFSNTFFLFCVFWIIIVAIQFTAIVYSIYYILISQCMIHVSLEPFYVQGTFLTEHYNN